MKLHANAALSLRQRERMVCRVVERGVVADEGRRGGRSQRAHLLEVGRALSGRGRARVCWIARRRRRWSPTAPTSRRVEAIAALRRLRFTGPEIAELLDRPLSTVSGILTRIGMGKLGRLGLEPAERYERARPGELIHIDVKKLGRIEGGAGKRVTGGGQHYTGSLTDAAGVRRGKAGWDYVHIAIDDATRLAYAEVLADEKATTAIGFLRRAVAFFARHGITVERAADRQRLALPLDRSTRSPAAPWASATCAPGPAARRPTAKPSASSAPCSAAGPTARSTRSSAERTAALDGWLWRYNHHRRHSAIGRQTPITRLNNLLGTYS